MHTCPDCGQACYCGGDFEDCPSDFDESGCQCTHCLNDGLDDIYTFSLDVPPEYDWNPDDDPAWVLPGDALVTTTDRARVRDDARDALDRPLRTTPIVTADPGAQDGGPR